MSDTKPNEPRPVVMKSRPSSGLMWILGISAVLFFFFIAISGAVWMGVKAITGGLAGGSAKPSRLHERLELVMGGKSKSSKSDGAGIAILEINGVIMDSKKTLKRLRELEEDSEVDAVIVRLNSPGGAVGPSQEIYEAVKNFPKPVVASMGSIAASGAFYIAVGAKKIYANPGTLTGSIGVIMEFANLGKLYEWAKIQRYSVTTGKFKDAGADYKPMNPEEKAYFQALVDDVLVQFKEAVAEGRKLKPEEVTPVADGRVFSGAQAKKLKLVDELGGIKDAAKAAAELAGKTGEPEILWPRPKGPRLLELMFEQADSEDEATSPFEGSRAAGNVAGQIMEGFLGVSAPSKKLEPGIYWIWPGARQ